MKKSKLTLNFSEINDLNKFSSVVNSEDYINTLLKEDITVVQSEVTGIVNFEKVTYAMVTVYSLTGIEYIVYKRIQANNTEFRKVNIGD